jgi:hypothetical protein
MMMSNIKAFGLSKQNLIGNIGLDKPELTLGEIEPLLHDPVQQQVRSLNQESAGLALR